MYTRSIRSDELYHYGVKGMHWGIRKDRFKQRHQLRKTMNRYDYKKSDKYINGDRSTRASMTSTHNQYATGRNGTRISRKQARNIDYKVFEQGKNWVNEYRKTVNKNKVKTLALLAAYRYGAPAARNILSGIGKNVYMNNLAANAAADMAGLNHVKGGFTPGFGALKRGAKAAKNVSRYVNR